MPTGTPRSEIELDRIIKLRKSGHSYAEIAHEFSSTVKGIQGTVNRLKHAGRL